MSYNSQYYGLSGKEEAEAYLAHPILGERLREITSVFLQLKNKTAAGSFRFVRCDESIVMHDAF